MPIGELDVGDLVLAWNQSLDSTDFYTVTAVWAHLDSTLLTLTIDDEQIETTPEHPFYIADNAWVAAGELWLGARVKKADGGYGTVKAISVVEAPQVMYNLTVEGAHTFYVGDEGWLVHNDCDSSLYHYTDAQGAQNIAQTGVIRANDDGIVYFTPDEVSQNDALYVLFAGNPGHTGRGSHVVESEPLHDDFPFQGGTQPNELIHVGSLRDGRNINIIRVGENQFGQ